MRLVHNQAMSIIRTGNGCDVWAGTRRSDWQMGPLQTWGPVGRWLWGADLVDREKTRWVRDASTLFFPQVWDGPCVDTSFSLLNEAAPAAIRIGPSLAEQR